MAHSERTPPALLENGPTGDLDNVEATLQITKLTIHEHVAERPSLQTLPTEILVLIFHLALAHNHARVVILAQICQSLRQVVVTTPMLWTTLSLSKERHPEEKVELWLSRNRGLLRALYIRDVSSGVQEALKALFGVSLDNLRALAMGERAWRSQYPAIALSFLTPAVVPNLISLTLTKINSRWEDGTSKLQIRHLHTRSSIYDWNALGNRSGQLRVLHYDDLKSGCGSILNMHGLLRSNPELESVTLTSFTLRSRPSVILKRLSPVGSIKLAHLTHLSLLGDMIPGKLFFPPLSLPNLRHLELEALCSQWDNTIQALITGNAVGELISLAIVHTYLSYSWEQEARPDIFIELFRHTKQLRCLELFRVTHIGPIVQALADNPTTLCPDLRTLDVSRCPDVDDELLIGIVDARNGSNYPLGDSPISAPTAEGTTLHKLVFNSCEKVTASTVSWLRDRVPHVTCHYNRERRERNRRKPKRDATHW